MSSRVQEKLLRLIEYGEFERVGGQETLRVDVRVIGATNADLRKLAAEQAFRADLLDRLSFDVVHLPPLRIRTSDTVELADHFAMQMSSELGWDLFPGFSDKALKQLLAHDWPGNVRELKNAVERSLYRWQDSSRPVGNIVIDPFRPPYSDAGETLPTPQVVATPEQSNESTLDFQTQVREFERQLLEQALAGNGQNQRRTAAAIGLTYDQIRGMVRKHELSK
jgi:psp operon transcriptional activator